MATPESTQLLEGFEFDTKSQQIHALLTFKQMDIESGLLGKFFGGPKTAPTNIVGLGIVLLVTFSMIATFLPGQSTPGEVWKYTAGLIGTLCGFVLREYAPRSNSETSKTTTQ